MTIFNHAFDISFSVESPDPEGRITAEQARKAILTRVNTLSDTELLEAIDAPWDTYQVDGVEADKDTL